MPDKPPGNAKPRFRLTVEPVEEDIDGLDHVNNLVFLRWVQDVAVAHSEAVGWSIDDYRALGAVFVVRRHEIEYRLPARLGDKIVLETWVSEWKGASSWRETRILREDDELVRARTRWAFMDHKSGRPTRIPEAISRAFWAVDADGA